jgi:16S rRNA (adenine1518-N6/adenine1519-N6)-dimethyltransferase
MSIEEIKRLLSAHRINPNKLLGQNFMFEPLLYQKLSSYAQLDEDDEVLDAGAGFGFLTRFLSSKCKTVVAVEKDPKVAKVLKDQVKDLGNVTVIEGDVLEAVLPPFNKIVGIPPYYLSSQLITWVLGKRVDCATLILQKEFGYRLVATVATREYGWLSVLVNQRAQVELLDEVPKEMFYPSPEVDSIIISLKPYRTKIFEVNNEDRFVHLVKWLFTQRNKKLANALVPFIKSNFKLSKSESETIALNIPFYESRVRELSPKDFGVIANALPN